MDDLVVLLFERFLGDVKKHSHSTSQVAFDCPACSEDAGLTHGDGKGNLEINYEKGVFNCWACGLNNDMQGHVHKLIKRYGNNHILNQYKLFKPEHNFRFISEEEDEKEKIVVLLPDEYEKITENTDNIATQYLEERGVSRDMMLKFSMGYCLTGFYKNRVIIPSYDLENKLNYFVSRSWTDGGKYKYLNPKADKEDIIFNEKFINWDATIYIVEGVFDHIVVPNSIPLLGKVLLPESRLKKMLIENSSAEVIIAIDADAIADAKYMYSVLNETKLKGRVKVVLINNEEGKDLSEIFQEQKFGGVIKILKTARRMTDMELYDSFLERRNNFIRKKNKNGKYNTKNS